MQKTKAKYVTKSQSDSGEKFYLHHDGRWPPQSPDDPGTARMRTIQNGWKNTNAQMRIAIFEWAYQRDLSATISDLADLSRGPLSDIVQAAISIAYDLGHSHGTLATKVKGKPAPRASTAVANKTPEDGPRDSRGRLIGKRAKGARKARRKAKLPPKAKTKRA